MSRFDAERLRARGGRMGLVDRFVFLREALVARLRQQGPAARRADPLAVAEVELPDSALVRWAGEVCAEASPSELVNHCVRTFLWGGALAKRDGVAFDAELAAVACLLHDLALTPKHPPPGDSCFAVHGAEVSRRLLEARGLSGERAKVVADAVCLHLNIEVSPALPEAYVVHEGAALDVIGARYGELEPHARDEVLRRFPRSRLKPLLVESLCAQGKRSPSTRMGLIIRLGFARFVMRAPFPEEP